MDLFEIRMKIDFSKLEVKSLIQKEGILTDVREPLANGLYVAGEGIAAHALAMKIYNSEGEVEYTDKEFDLIKSFVERNGTPMMIDAINNLLKQ